MSSPLRGVATLERTADDRAAAPASGVLLGSGPDGPRALRLFRQPGTRIVVFTSLTTPQLLVARAGRLGVGVRVRTTRPDVWRAALRLADDAVVAPPGPEPAPSGRLTAPVLIVDDRPGENAPPGDVGGWQCRLDVRTGPNPADVGQYLGVDLVLVERLSPPVAEALAVTFGLPRGASSTLTTLPGDGVALVRPGRVEVVSVAPAPDERGFMVAVSAPVRPPSAPPGRAAGTGWPSAPARPLSRPGPSGPPGAGPVPGSVRPPVPPPAAPGAGPAGRPATPGLPPPPARPRPGGTPPPTLPPPPPRPGRGRHSA